MVQRKRVTKVKYRRSTPVIRLRRNVEKLCKTATLVRDRLAAWKTTSDADVLSGEELAADVVSLLHTLGECAARMEESGFVPPVRSKAADYDVGDVVRVVDAYRPRYETAYKDRLSSDPSYLDELVVSERLLTGELTVRRTQRSQPIIVRKSHVSRCRK